MDLWMELKRLFLVVGSIFLGFMVSVGALIVPLDTAQPFLVVESRRMQHDDSLSAIGIIDTGDVAVASEPWIMGTVRMYVDLIIDGYTSLADLGDVIVYRSPGHSKPIVYRSLVELVYNGQGGSDIPTLAKVPLNMWWAPVTPG
jgi:signal peptidase